MVNYDEIRKLKVLLDQGVLTQEEFDTQKQAILSGPVSGKRSPVNKVSYSNNAFLVMVLGIFIGFLIVSCIGFLIVDLVFGGRSALFSPILDMAVGGIATGLGALAFMKWVNMQALVGAAVFGVVGTLLGFFGPYILWVIVSFDFGVLVYATQYIDYQLLNVVGLVSVLVNSALYFALREQFNKLSKFQKA